MKLIITIDTEEDNWGSYNSAEYTLENIKNIPKLQAIFDKYGVHPTYLITYPVASDAYSVELLQSISSKHRCEIGAHCHPWNTPPIIEERNAYNSMLCNLSEELQMRKLENLTETIAKKFKRDPTSFRAGRWGFGDVTAKCLCRLGYLVDTSVLAYQNWKADHGPDYSMIDPEKYDIHFGREPKNRIIEMPATSGYIQGNFQRNNKIWKLLEKRVLRKLKLKGILRKLNFLSKAWLSPETASESEMILLSQAMKESGYQHLNMFFHSTALKAGLSPFVQNANDEEIFYQKIENYLKKQKKQYESIKLSDVRLSNMR